MFAKWSLHRRFHHIVHVSAILVFSLALWGCAGSDGANGIDGLDGNNGTNGTNGTDGTNGNNGVDGVDGVTPNATVDISDADTLADLVAAGEILQAEIQDVTVSSPPVIDFSLATNDGTPIVGLASGKARFTIAKLMPASGGNPAYWRSYLNDLEETDGDLPDDLAQALQATRESNGTLVDHEDGTYTYTFANDIAAITDPVTIAYDDSLTHRVGMEISLNSAINPDNATFTFVPDGSTLTTTKDIAAITSCNNCHYRLSAHGGSRNVTDHCVTCHNPGTRDQDGGELLDMAYMIHSVHAKEPRTTEGVPYVVYGHNESEVDFSEVTYPQNTLYCETCHTQSAGRPDGDNWKSTVTATACGGCHAGGLIPGTPDGTTGLTTYQYEHESGLNYGALVCTTCHGEGTAITIPGDANGRTIDPEHAHMTGARLARYVADTQFEFRILDVQDVGGGDNPTVKFQVWNPLASTSYDITSDDEFVVANGASLNILIGWESTDLYNEGSGNAPGQPISINLTTLQASAVDNLDGTYSITSATAIPAGVTSEEIVVAMEGHPIADIDADGSITGSGDRVPAQGVTYYPNTARRTVVSIENCNNCHEHLSLHGSNRNAEPQLCVMCHNPDATDINRRPGDWEAPGAASDGRGEQSIAFSYMIHSIHASNIVLYGFGGTEHAYTEVTYPGELFECTACHDGNTYFSAGGDARPITVGTGAILDDPSDDEAITATAAACYGCHNSTSATAHMEQNGAVIVDGDWQTGQDVLGDPPATAADQVTAEGGRPLKGDIGNTAASVESCATCHAEGRIADIEAAHGL